MDYNVILSVCIAFIAAIMGISYPLMMSSVSIIGERFNSVHLQKLFEKEFPMRKISFLRKKYTFFEFFLIIALLAVVLVIVDFEPRWGLDNSNLIFLLITTIALIIVFLYWMRVLLKYRGPIHAVFSFVKNRYYKIDDPFAPNQYTLKAINELALYTYRANDEHLQTSIQSFYSDLFNRYRSSVKKEDYIEFPSDLYEVVYMMTRESVQVENSNLSYLKSTVVSMSWLLGDRYDNGIISYQTYNWLWRCLLEIGKDTRAAEIYWRNANRYYQDKFEFIPESLEGEDRNAFVEERNKFLELNHHFVAYLLSIKAYNSLPYILSYSSSFPPKYVLFPSMKLDVLEGFMYYADYRRRMFDQHGPKYRFPSVDNLGNELNMNYWLCMYFALLFLRSHLYTHNQDSISLKRIDPVLLDSWNLHYATFEKLIKALIRNKELHEVLGYEAQFEEEEILQSVSNFKANIVNTIDVNHRTQKLFEKKVDFFMRKTKQIISNTLKMYGPIFKTAEKVADKAIEYSCNSVYGMKGKLPRTAFLKQYDFIDNDVVIGNYMKEKIETAIGDSFIHNTTYRYVLEKSKLRNGLKNLAKDKRKLVAVCFQCDSDVLGILKDIEPVTQILEFERPRTLIPNSFFIMRHSDLPAIIDSNKDFSETQNDRTVKLEDVSATIDFIDEPDQNDEEPKVDVIVNMELRMCWKNTVKVIRFNIASEFYEQGVVNSIDDIIPF